MNFFKFIHKTRGKMDFVKRILLFLLSFST